MESLTALADPTRRRIVEILAAGPLPSGEIARRVAFTPPAISQHLKILKEVRLVRMRPEAQRRIYELDPAGIGEISEWLERIRAFWTGKLDALATQLKDD